MRRAMFLSGLLCLSLSAALAARQSATEANAKPWEKFLGAWKEVPQPDAATLIKVEREGNGIKYGFVCKQDGSCTYVIVGNYDGKPYKVSGNASWEASFRKTGDRTLQEDDYTSGKLERTIRWAFSPDGNMVTRIDRYVSPPAPKDISYAYDRIGGPVSQDDPFIGFWKRNWNKSEALLTTFAAKGDVLTLSAPEGYIYERNCDDRDHPEAYETNMVYNCRFTNAYTYELALKQNEKVTFSMTRKISDDGKKMVLISKNAEGKTTSEEAFEKIK